MSQKRCEACFSQGSHGLSASRQTLRKAIFMPAEDTVELVSIQVLALFSSPHKLPDGSRIQQLPLMRELLELQKSVFKKKVLPAARFPQDVEASLKSYLPRIVQFSGHGWRLWRVSGHARAGSR